MNYIDVDVWNQAGPPKIKSKPKSKKEKDQNKNI